MSDELVFLKLGGSLITHKMQSHTPRMDVLSRLADEIAAARTENPGLKILLGHGSGSFGHVPASKYHTRQGVRSAAEWLGFAEVWREAADLNHIVMEALARAGLPVVALPPSAAVTARGGKVETWNLEPLKRALEHNLLPLINGDTIFDSHLGGTILSTEDLFVYLAGKLLPGRVLLAGSELGVWADYPANTRLLEEITPGSLDRDIGGIKGSSATDVTGGMVEKVRQVVAMVEASPTTRAVIFSGEQPGNVQRLLLGEPLGTLIHA
jgi:isopentenyl phosphate kinase